MGLSSALRRVSKSSRIRSSTESGSLRVTMTSGFLLFAIGSQLRYLLRYLVPVWPGADLALINRARPHCGSGDYPFVFLPDGRDNTKLPKCADWPRPGGRHCGTGTRPGLFRRRCSDRLCERASDSAIREPQIGSG